MRNARLMLAATALVGAEAIRAAKRVNISDSGPRDAPAREGGDRRLKPSDNVPPHVRAAAREAADRGESRRVSGKPLVYNAHQGAREIARRAKRIAAGKLKADE